MSAKWKPSSCARARPGAVAISTLASLLVALPACSGKKGHQALQASRADLPPSAPGVRGSQNGMEMMWWGVLAGPRELAELFSPFLVDGPKLDARTSTLWRANGLRLVCVPIDRIDSLRQALPQSGGSQRQWLGQVAEWTDLIHGTGWADVQPVEMDNGRLDLGPGRMRVLLRCWTIPVPGNEAGEEVHSAMRAELLLQHQEKVRVDPAALYSRPSKVTDPVDEGLVFNRLALNVTLPADHALLVVPESPEIDWRALAQIPLEEFKREQAALAETRQPTDPLEGSERAGVGQVFRERAARRDRGAASLKVDKPGPFDPAEETSRTLGELLLTPNGSRLQTGIADRAPARSILVLVPRIPGRFVFETPAPTK